MISTILRTGQYYHIYNRGNNSEILFRTSANHLLFLKLYAKYMFPVVDTLAYCLMSNHFHFVIRTKDEKDIRTMKELNMFDANKLNLITDKKPTASRQFSHLFISYSKTINKAYNRTGSLFEHPFERRIIETEAYLKRCIAYVHANPLKAKVVGQLGEYKWSSYEAIVSEKPTHLEREFVLNLFGGKENFRAYHADFDMLLEL